MHNSISRITRGDNRDRFNANLLEHSLSSHMFNYWIPAGDFYDISTTTVSTWTNPTASLLPCWAWGDVDRYSVGTYIAKNREWRSGIVMIEPHFMCASATGTPSVYCGIVPLSYGNSITAWPTTGTSINKIISNPGALKLYVTKPSLYASNSSWTAPINDSHVGIQIFVGRDGTDTGDTMNDTLYFLGARIKYIEGEKSIGENYDPIRR